MNRIKVFLCASSKDLLIAEVFRKLLCESYGFNVFLFKHNIVGSNDFHKEILKHLNDCEIFIPLISQNLRKSSFCNQEIGFTVNRTFNRRAVIFPISIDETKTYDLIDHIHAHPCTTSEDYGILKSATSFFHIVMCHNGFSMFKEKAIEGMIEALHNSSGWESTSAIIYMLELTNKEIKLSNRQLNRIKIASKNNPNIYEYKKLLVKLKTFLQNYYGFGID